MIYCHIASQLKGAYGCVHCTWAFYTVDQPLIMIDGL